MGKFTHEDISILEDLERCVRWLSTWTIHNANHIRKNTDGLKVGGHQASCTRFTTLMGALYLKNLHPEDRVAVKPHGAPVMHPIEYLIAGSWRRILVTITGFTVAHSMTLALAALNLVWVPIPPVEAVIALSIVFLAVEIARRRRDTLTWRYPIAISGSFGLLHGFGFASVLNEIGLPQTEIPAALLFFNVGVEIGQILFVALLFLVVTGLSMFGMWQGEMKSKSRLFVPDYLIRPAAYLVGVLAVYWTIDRIAGFVV
jgi:hypothetical protein